DGIRDRNVTGVQTCALPIFKRGGRVSIAAALIGSALAVKPLLTLDDGTVVALEKIRTRAKALARAEDIIVERARACTAGYQIGVQHLANAERAREVAQHIAEDRKSAV